MSSSTSTKLPLGHPPSAPPPYTKLPPGHPPSAPPPYTSSPIVFALGKFHPPHSGHINILGAALKSFADQGLTSILFISTKTNKIDDIQLRMDTMRTTPRYTGDGRGQRSGINSHPSGGYEYTKEAIAKGADFGDKKNPKNFPNSTIPVKGQAIASTQKSIYDRVHKYKHINIEKINDTPLTPDLKIRIMEHALNSRGGNPVIIRESDIKIGDRTYYALNGIKKILETDSDYGFFNGVTPLIMLAGSDHMKGKENYHEQLAKIGFENFRVEQVGDERPEVGDIYSGKTLRHLAHEAYDESNSSSTPILNTPSGDLFAKNTGYIAHEGDEAGKALTLKAIDQIVKHTPRGGKRKSRKRKYNKKRKTKKGKRNRRVKTKRKRNKRKVRSRCRK